MLHGGDSRAWLSRTAHYHRHYSLCAHGLPPSIMSAVALMSLYILLLSVVCFKIGQTLQAVQALRKVGASLHTCVQRSL